MMGRGRRWHPAGYSVALLLAGVAAAPGDARALTLDGVFNGRQPTMPYRVARTGNVSTCANPQPFPGIFPTADDYDYETFEFCNDGPQRCVTVEFDPGTCGHEVHLLGYLRAFDPLNLAESYAGDIGASESGAFSFIVPPNEPFLVVAQTNFDSVECRFSFTTDATPCRAAAPALSRSIVALLIGLLMLLGLAALRRKRTV